MTAPDRPVVDLIAEVQRRHAWSAAFGGCSGGCEWVSDPQDDTEQDQHAAHVAAAVVAACQRATVDQQAELTGGGNVEHGVMQPGSAAVFIPPSATETLAGPLTDVTRIVGPWREDPS